MNLINEPVQFSREGIAKVEALKNAKWLLDTEKPENSNIPVSIFYQEVPYEGSHYFGLYYGSVSLSDDAKVHAQLMITDGAWIEGLTIDAMEAANGDVIFSRFRHDFVTSPDGTATIDGGRAYTRTSLGAKPRTIKVKDGEVLLS